MKATRIYYEQKRNIGNYENETIGIELVLEAGDTADMAIDKARDFLARVHLPLQANHVR